MIEEEVEVEVVGIDLNPALPSMGMNGDRNYLLLSVKYRSRSRTTCVTLNAPSARVTAFAP